MRSWSGPRTHQSTVPLPRSVTGLAFISDSGNTNWPSGTVLQTDTCSRTRNKHYLIQKNSGTHTTTEVCHVSDTAIAHLDKDAISLRTNTSEMSAFLVLPTPYAGPFQSSLAIQCQLSSKSLQILKMRGQNRGYQDLAYPSFSGLRQVLVAEEHVRD